MAQKFSIGQQVYFTPGFSGGSSSATFKIISVLPVENDDRRRYRIKSAGEPHERIADENQLSKD
jgi:hypothetical protein